MQFSSRDSERRFSFLKKRMKPPRVSRLKLQEEFAGKGWQTCFMQLENELDESECEIAFSPTKSCEISLKCKELKDRLKRKPMLAEISNIECLFKEDNESKSLKKIVKRPLQNCFTFVQELDEKNRSNQNCDSKRSKSDLVNLKKLKADFRIEYEVNRFKQDCISNTSKHKSLQQKPAIKYSNDKFRNKNFDSVIAIKDVCSQVPDSSVEVFNSSLSYFKSEKCKNLNQVPQSFNHKRSHSEFIKFDGHLPPGGIKNLHCEESLKTSNNVADTSIISSKNNFKNELSYKYLNRCKNVSKSHSLGEKFIENFNVEINIEEEDNSIISSIESLNTIPKISNRKRLGSEAFNLYDIQELFLIDKKHYDVLSSSDDTASLITDISPIKSNSEKKNYSSSKNKFKEVSEAFTMHVENENITNKNIDFDVLNQTQFNHVYVKSTKNFPSSLSISSFEDGKDSLYSKDELSEEKHVVCDSITFIKALQTNFHDKSSVADKGSSWVQSLNWDDDLQPKDTGYEYNAIGKKLVKNIVHGGFAEQMLKIQRRERSDRVIWDHKVDELKKKSAGKSIGFTLMSIFDSGSIIVTKCKLESDDQNMVETLYSGNLAATNSIPQPSIQDEDMPSCDTLHSSKSGAFIVLFKKSLFSKLHPKVGDVITLYPPWQLLSLPSVTLPVILCTYFIDVNYKPMETSASEISEVNPDPVIYNSLPLKHCNCEEALFLNASFFNLSDLYGKPLCISARIQRIWKTGIMSSKVQNILKSNDYLSFSVLLQTKDNVFVELKINSGQLSESYHEFLRVSESECYRFCDITLSYRYNLKECPKWSNCIQFILNKTENCTASPPQMFCYQFIPNLNKMPCKISDENFPPYCDYEVKQLSCLQKNLNGGRFNFIGKIMFQNSDEFYISDESLLNSKLEKYYKLKFAYSCTVLKQAIVGATVLIKEAVADTDGLFVDQFSNCEAISNAIINKLPLCQSRLKKIDLMTYEHILPYLTLSCKEKEFVIVKGTISHVDEQTAMSWLECSYCLNENLLEDSSSVIYCEDCSCVVPNPVLKVKMEVVVISPSWYSAKVKIQLLSSTVKRILKINEDNYQPECNISDVLDKNTDDLCCYIKNIDTADNLKVFHLIEINCRK